MEFYCHFTKFLLPRELLPKTVHDDDDDDGDQPKYVDCMR